MTQDAKPEGQVLCKECGHTLNLRFYQPTDAKGKWLLECRHSEPYNRGFALRRLCYMFGVTFQPARYEQDFEAFRAWVDQRNRTRNQDDFIKRKA